MTPEQFEALAQPILEGQPSPQPNWRWVEHHGTTWPLSTSDLQVKVVEDRKNIDEPTRGTETSPELPEEEEEGRLTSEAYRFHGVDILAFYKTFRLKAQPPCRGMWGIFLLLSGLRSMTDLLADVRPDLPRTVLATLARKLILAHESYHFFVDVHALAMEGGELEKPFPHLYLPYLHATSEPGAPPELDLEEALANHFAYQQLRNHRLPDGTRQGPLIATVLENGPIPYCDFSMGPIEHANTEGLLGLAIRMGEGCYGAGALLECNDMYPGFYSVAMTPMATRHPFAPINACPVHTCRVVGLTGILTPFQGPSRREMESFVTEYLQAKPMPRTDHQFYCLDNGETVKFPNPHAESIYGYEFKNILKKAGMTLAQYNEERLRTRVWRKGCPRDPARPPI